jgi:hypothetical protein
MLLRGVPYVLWLLTFAWAGGCTCGRFSGEASDVSFKRCALADPPSAGKRRVGALTLEVDERALTIRGAGKELRLGAFTGPVGAALTRVELARISAAAPDLLLMLGELGDSVEAASASLVGLAALGPPVLFVPGGGDRLEVIQEAFETLTDAQRAGVIDASGLRELRIGRDSFAIVPGAPLGRYALDDDSCGFETDDLEAVAEALAPAVKQSRRIWLLSWGAPSGFGVTRGLGSTELGSSELSELARDLGAKGGLFAFPETSALVPSRAAGALALVVPRLGRTGSTRREGGRVPSMLAILTLGPDGLKTGAGAP